MAIEGLKLESLLEELFDEQADLTGVKLFKLPRPFATRGGCCVYSYAQYD